jgi:hypothetical protein
VSARHADLFEQVQVLVLLEGGNIVLADSFTPDLLFLGAGQLQTKLLKFLEHEGEPALAPFLELLLDYFPDVVESQVDVTGPALAGGRLHDVLEAFIAFDEGVQLLVDLHLVLALLRDDPEDVAQVVVHSGDRLLVELERVAHLGPGALLQLARTAH